MGFAQTHWLAMVSRSSRTRDWPRKRHASLRYSLRFGHFCSTDKGGTRSARLGSTEVSARKQRGNCDGQANRRSRWTGKSPHKYDLALTKSAREGWYHLHRKR